MQENSNPFSYFKQLQSEIRRNKTELGVLKLNLGTKAKEVEELKSKIGKWEDEEKSLGIEVEVVLKARLNDFFLELMPVDNQRFYICKEFENSFDDILKKEVEDYLQNSYTKMEIIKISII